MVSVGAVLAHPIRYCLSTLLSIKIGSISSFVATSESKSSYIELKHFCISAVCLPISNKSKIIADKCCSSKFSAAIFFARYSYVSEKSIECSNRVRFFLFIFISRCMYCVVQLFVTRFSNMSRLSGDTSKVTEIFSYEEFSSFLMYTSG